MPSLKHTKKVQTARSKFDEKLVKIGEAFKSVILPLSEDREEVLKQMLEICYIGKNLSRELKEHAGIYSYLATHLQNLKEHSDQLAATNKQLEEDSDNCVDTIIAIVRATNPKVNITAEKKKEIISMIKSDVFKDSELYQSIEDEDMLEQVVGASKKASECWNEQRELVDDILKTRSSIGLMEQMVSAIAYQKQMALRALVDLEMNGLNQNLGE